MSSVEQVFIEFKIALIEIGDYINDQGVWKCTLSYLICYCIYFPW